MFILICGELIVGFFALRTMTRHQAFRWVAPYSHVQNSEFLYCSAVKVYSQVDTKRCRPSWLTNSARIYEPKCGGETGWLWGLSQRVQLYTGAQINFGDLTPYLTYLYSRVNTGEKGYKYHYSIVSLLSMECTFAVWHSFGRFYPH